MRFALPLGIKFALQLSLFGLLLPLVYRVSLFSVVDAAVLFWVVSFLTVDLAVLPGAGPAAACPADLILGMAAVGVVVGAGPSWALLGIGAAVAVAEYFFHDALLTRGLVGRSPR